MTGSFSLEVPVERATAPGRPMVLGDASFGEAYFGPGSNYGGRYDWYNPPHKLRGYLGEVLSFRRHGTLIDAGCAFGRFLEYARRHFECAGVDISTYALGIAAARLPGVALYHTALQAFTAPRQYDVVTCFDVLEHIPDLDAALQHLRALVAPGGVVAVAVPVYDTPAGWLFRLIDRDPTHLHRYGRAAWLARLRQAGLEPVAWKGILRLPLGRFFLHVISPAFRRCSSAIFVVCRPGGSRAAARADTGPQEGLDPV